MDNRPLGSYIFGQVRETGRDIEVELDKISANGEEWAINIDYSFQFSPKKKIRDCFTVTASPYINDKRQGAYTFKFASIEAISLNEICEVIYKVSLSPDQAERIIEESIVNVELV